MNPAALKTNLGDLEDGGILLINTDAFTRANLNKAGYKSNPLEDGSLSRYRVFKVPITALNAKALEGLDMSQRQMERCKSFSASSSCPLSRRTLARSFMLSATSG